MPSKEVPYADRVAAAYPRLVTASNDLNTACAGLAKSLKPIEKILGKLSLSF
jgi:hypothetical protein